MAKKNATPAVLDVAPTKGDKIFDVINIVIIKRPFFFTCNNNAYPCKINIIFRFLNDIFFIVNIRKHTF